MTGGGLTGLRTTTSYRSQLRRSSGKTWRLREGRRAVGKGPTGERSKSTQSIRPRAAGELQHVEFIPNRPSQYDCMPLGSSSIQKSYQIDPVNTTVHRWGAPVHGSPPVNKTKCPRRVKQMECKVVATHDG